MYAIRSTEVSGLWSVPFDNSGDEGDFANLMERKQMELEVKAFETRQEAARYINSGLVPARYRPYVVDLPEGTALGPQTTLT